MKKLTLALAALALSGMLISGNTGAYFFDDKQAKNAAFETIVVDIEFAASQDDVAGVLGQMGTMGGPSVYPIVKEAAWGVENVGEMDAYLRVLPHISGIDVNKIKDIYTDSDDWTKKSDGYFYSNEPLEAGGTISFPLKVKIDPKGSGSFKADITVEAIQAANNAKEAVWGSN